MGCAEQKKRSRDDEEDGSCQLALSLTRLLASLTRTLASLDRLATVHPSVRPSSYRKTTRQAMREFVYGQQVHSLQRWWRDKSCRPLASRSPIRLAAWTGARATRVVVSTTDLLSTKQEVCITQTGSDSEHFAHRNTTAHKGVASGRIDHCTRKSSSLTAHSRSRACMSAIAVAVLRRHREAMSKRATWTIALGMALSY